MQIGWYNEQVHKAFHLDYTPDTLAVVVISTPLMFDQGFKPFVRETDCLGDVRDPIDECMAHYFDKVKQELRDLEIETIHDFDILPSRRPKILVQTAAHVAGAARFYQRSDITNDPWAPETKICGVCLHAKYGGWFAIRGVVIFKDVIAADLQHIEPADTLGDDEKRIELLEKFNFHWRDWTFRDIAPTEMKYSEEQKKYFATVPGQRKELLAALRKNTEQRTPEKQSDKELMED